jgi:hypothetical protein
MKTAVDCLKTLAQYKALPPLSGNLLETLQDDALGVWLWMTFIQTQARDLGIPAT